MSSQTAGSYGVVTRDGTHAIKRPHRFDRAADAHVRQEACVLCALTAAANHTAFARHLARFKRFDPATNTLVMEDVPACCTLADWTHAQAHTQAPYALLALLHQVCATLACFECAFPGFRHGDLHGWNVLVTAAAADGVGMEAADGGGMNAVHGLRLPCQLPLRAVLIDWGHAGQVLPAPKQPRLPAADPRLAPHACDMLKLVESLLPLVQASEHAPDARAALVRLRGALALCSAGDMPYWRRCQAFATYADVAAVVAAAAATAAAEAEAAAATAAAATAKTAAAAAATAQTLQQQRRQLRRLPQCRVETLTGRPTDTALPTLAARTRVTATSSSAHNSAVVHAAHDAPHTTAPHVWVGF